MLFMVDHTHTVENCPCGKIKPIKDFQGKMKRAAKASGLKLNASYSDWGGHHFYYIIEAETQEQINGFISPNLTNLGITHVHPISEW